MKYGTVCSGVEAHSLSVEGFGDEAVFFSEIEKPQGQLLSTHWPNVPNFGDFTKIHIDDEKGVITNVLRKGEQDELPSCFYHAPVIEFPFNRGELDILSGGIPCTDVSIAGKREGMAEGSGTRSSLAFNYQSLINDLQPKFVVYENVPGIFSSNGGKDFIWFISKIMNLGYSIAWRTLDAQYVMTDMHPRAVPQRRRRLWLVAYRGNDWRIPASVLFENNDALTNTPPMRLPGKGFVELNPDFDESEVKIKNPIKTRKQKVDNTMSLFGDSEESSDVECNIPKVSEIIPLSEMPDNPDFSKIPQATILQFVKKLGVPGFIGNVFRNDKKKNKKKQAVAEFDLFGNNEQKTEEVNHEDTESEEYEGAEKISPGILADIGNAGILSNGRIATIHCSEWTSGIQLNPKNYNLYLELKKNWKYLVENDLIPEDLFPKAYDGTLCGLSDVLEEDPDEKYNLSWRACYGILKRAYTRGKELPVALEVALISTIIDNAEIVKWVVLNGRDTKKKETDMSEKEIAKDCYDKYIQKNRPFDTVEAVAPKKNNDEDEEDEIDEEDIKECEANDIDEVFGLPKPIDGGNVVDDISGQSDDVDDIRNDKPSAAMSVDTKLDASRVEEEVSPTLLASSYKEPPAVIK